MKIRFAGAVIMGLMLAASSAAHADRLDDIKKAGVLRVATFDSNPPFGFVDPKNNQIVGLDVDYARAVADKLGVKLEIQPTNPANRIAFLKSGKVDLVFANFTITNERKKEVDFSTPYFASGTQFIAKKGVLKTPQQLNSLRVGADKGTTNEQQVRAQFPGATIVAYDDTPFAFAALRTGNVQAITQDGPKLVALLANVPDKANYEISPFTISNDYEGVGVPKGEARLLSVVDDTLKGLEANGTAGKIYDQWFGPTSRAPLPRLFKIGDPQKS
ncbi:ABC transporter substrate-binding protein [Paraburkholderia terrae]|uniref:Amino acid ABC transporter substrate-binding protein n=1 Tax=Paraburkholderia terrae TaxID=311230 RepID=A0A2I8F228_9BURK|nr:ABC transporter substrate-binding protein [Paraburkholderia terrae]AUT65935.1 amino acid ABC transporter substrate-binding protein [Paraburkholderia terrae]